MSVNVVNRYQRPPSARAADRVRVKPASALFLVAGAGCTELALFVAWKMLAGAAMYGASLATFTCLALVLGASVRVWLVGDSAAAWPSVSAWSSCGSRCSRGWQS